jgi:hypothetical protein
MYMKLQQDEITLREKEIHNKDCNNNCWRPNSEIFIKSRDYF